jgi:uncharacterized protein
MIINIIKTYRDVVAICDKEILGKHFEQDNLQLDIKENFYKGETGKEVSEEEAKEIIENMSVEDSTFNIVGEKSIALAIEMNLIEKDSVKKIQGIPYSMVLI